VTRRRSHSFGRRAAPPPYETLSRPWPGPTFSPFLAPRNLGYAALLFLALIRPDALARDRFIGFGFPLKLFYNQPEALTATTVFFTLSSFRWSSILDTRNDRFIRCGSFLCLSVRSPIPFFFCFRLPRNPMGEPFLLSLLLVIGPHT